MRVSRLMIGGRREGGSAVAPADPKRQGETRFTLIMSNFPAILIIARGAADPP